METTFSCTLNGIIIVGWLCEVTYTNPLYSPLLYFLFYFTPIKGAGAWPLVPLAMPVTVVQPGFVNVGPKRGSEATERGQGVVGGMWEGESPSHGREIFQNLCLKTTFSCTLDTFIRGSLCSGIDQFPTLDLFSFFLLMNLFQGNIFLSPFFLLFYSPINGGGGGEAWPPCAS